MRMQCFAFVNQWVTQAVAVLILTETYRLPVDAMRELMLLMLNVQCSVVVQAQAYDVCQGGLSTVTPAQRQKNY